MQIFILNRDPAYRGVAEKIFFKLMAREKTSESKYESLEALMNKHAREALKELASVDQ